MNNRVTYLSNKINSVVELLHELKFKARTKIRRMISKSPNFVMFPFKETSSGEVDLKA